MSNPYKRLKYFFHSTFNHDTAPSEQEEDVYKFQPLKMCLEYKSDVKKALKYPNNFPMPRSGHRIVCNDDSILSFGGYNPRTTAPRTQSDELYKELWKFDVVQKKWRLLDVANIPPYAASNCCTLIGSNILTIFGGTSFPFGHESGNDLYVLDLNKETEFEIITGEKGTDAEEEESGRKPPGRYGQAVVIYDSKLYTFGGTTGYVYSMDVHCHNIKTRTWSCLYHSIHCSPGDPEPRYRHEVAEYGGRFYLLGGGTEEKAFNLEDIHSFDLSTNSWLLHHTRPDPVHCYPPPRKCHALSQSRLNRAHLVIFGGIGAYEPVLSDIWRLDLDTLTWSKINLTLPYPLYFHALATSPRDKIWIFGGITSAQPVSRSSTDVASSERTADLYSLYVTVPSLHEMCSEAVKYYYRKQIYDEHTLSAYGVHMC